MPGLFSRLEENVRMKLIMTLTTPLYILLLVSVILGYIAFTSKGKKAAVMATLSSMSLVLFCAHLSNYVFGIRYKYTTESQICRSLDKAALSRTDTYLGL